MMQIRPHALVQEGQVIEVQAEDGTLLCAIYQTPTGVKIVSHHIRNRPDLVVIDPGEPPALLINLR